MFSNKFLLAFSFLQENLIYCLQVEDQKWMHTIEEKKVTLNSTVRFQVFNMVRYCSHTKSFLILWFCYESLALTDAFPSTLCMFPRQQNQSVCCDVAQRVVLAVRSGGHAFFYRCLIFDSLRCFSNVSMRQTRLVCGYPSVGFSSLFIAKLLYTSNGLNYQVNFVLVLVCRQRMPISSQGLALVW